MTAAGLPPHITISGPVFFFRALIVKSPDLSFPTIYPAGRDVQPTREMPEPCLLVPADLTVTGLTEGRSNHSMVQC